jgi:hypothetical protein
MNIIIAQQILIRYDALALTLEGTPMLNYYTKRVLQPAPPPLSNTSSTGHATPTPMTPLSLSASSVKNTTMITSSYYKVRYHDELYQLANQFITNILIASSSSSSTPSSSLSTMTISATGGAYHEPILEQKVHQYHEAYKNTAATFYTFRAYQTHFQQQMDLFRTILDSLQPSAQIPMKPTTTTTTTTTIITPPFMNRHSTTTVPALSSSSQHPPPSLPPQVEEPVPESPRHLSPPYPTSSSSSPSTSSYWYNTLKYTLSSYYETMMRYSIKTYIQMGLFEDRLGLEPGFLSNRGQSLTKEMELIVQWRQEKLNWYTTFLNLTKDKSSTTTTIIDHSAQQPLYYYNYYNPLYHQNGTMAGRNGTLNNPDVPSSPLVLSSSSSVSSPSATKSTTEKKLSGLQIFHLTLNMLAAFLYCMNYYVRRGSTSPSSFFLHTNQHLIFSIRYFSLPSLSDC